MPEDLKNFVETLDKFYIINDPKMIHQNLKSAEDLYQALQAKELQLSNPLLHHFSLSAKHKTEAAAQKPKNRPDFL